jgi:hypothetical protein
LQNDYPQYQLVGIFIPATGILTLCCHENFYFNHTVLQLF